MRWDRGLAKFRNCSGVGGAVGAGVVPPPPQACGQRRVVKGMWSMACGQRHVVKGMWSKACGLRQNIRKSATSDFDNLVFLKYCSWISRLRGIGGRLRRLQRPGVVPFQAFTRNSKANKSKHSPKSGNLTVVKSPKMFFENSQNGACYSRK